MPPPSIAVDAPRPVAAINSQIRQLMELPSSAERSEEYIRLLTLWADVSERPDVASAVSGQGPTSADTR